MEGGCAKRNSGCQENYLRTVTFEKEKFKSMNTRKLCSIVALCACAGLIIACSNDCRKAEQLIAQKQYDKAIDLLENYIKTNPNDNVGFMLLGDAYIGKAISIGGPVYNPATVNLAVKGSDYYKKSYELKRTREIDNKMALASQLLEAP